MAGERPYAIRDPDVTHVVLEMFGGDNNLNDQVYEDLGEMVAGNTGSIAVLALADFIDRGAIVVELTSRVGARVVEELGEIDTGDPDTLTSFLARALVTYAHVPHVAIGFWDHGSGVFGEFDDRQRLSRSTVSSAGAPKRASRARTLPARRLLRPRRAPDSGVGVRAMLRDDTNGGLLTTVEGGEVLRRALAAAGRSRVDMVFSDTCLNGMVEVTSELGPYAEVAVASEELEPNAGWDYTLWLRRTSKQRPATASAWAGLAVQSYEDSYRYRPDLHPVTMAAFRTDSGLVERFGELVTALRATNGRGRDWVETARREAQSFARMDTYDLGDWLARLADLAARAHAGEVFTAAEAVRSAYFAARVAETHLGSSVSAASGLGLWIPSTRSELMVTGGTYRQLRFDDRTGWWAFLAG